MLMDIMDAVKYILNQHAGDFRLVHGIDLLLPLFGGQRLQALLEMLGLKIAPMADAHPTAVQHLRGSNLCGHQFVREFPNAQNNAGIIQEADSHNIAPRLLSEVGVGAVAHQSALNGEGAAIVHEAVLSTHHYANGYRIHRCNLQFYRTVDRDSPGGNDGTIVLLHGCKFLSQPVNIMLASSIIF